ncbi:MAG: aminoacyl-tRNA hydrolase [Myxococcales bacterium]|nr:aminoacyl-tRNA hydrolase [Myxococcales bacterium]|tara:strand:- start:27 stop:629 length:603 start_codon:yes stop_codon:yes gene_type:complete
MLIVGLGNPGPEYAETRHNIGFMVLDELADRIGAQWSQGRRFAHTRGRFSGRVVTLLKPFTFMNRSGEVVADRARFFQLDVDDVLVVHDDLDLPFGSIRVKKGGGLAGHNGLKSIAERMGSRDFGRIRVGIGRPEHSGQVRSFVLEAFAPTEKEHLLDVLGVAHDATELFLNEEIKTVQNMIHGKNVVTDKSVDKSEPQS